MTGRFDAEDSARLLAGFRGLPLPFTPTLRHVRSAGDTPVGSYVWDEETGLVYMLD